MRDFRSIFKTSTKWTHALMSLIYFKQFFSIGEECKLLNLEYILYSPFIMLLWMYCFYFWSARINAEDLTDKIMFSIFLFVGLCIPLLVFLITKNISLALPLIIISLEPIKNKILYGKIETKSYLPNTIILLASLVIFLISGGISLLFNLKDFSILYGFLYYSFFFYFEQKIIKKFINS